MARRREVFRSRVRNKVLQGECFDRSAPLSISVFSRLIFERVSRLNRGVSIVLDFLCFNLIFQSTRRGLEKRGRRARTVYIVRLSSMVAAKISFTRTESTRVCVIIFTPRKNTYEKQLKKLCLFRTFLSLV